MKYFVSYENSRINKSNLALGKCKFGTISGFIEAYISAVIGLK